MFPENTAKERSLLVAGILFLAASTVTVGAAANGQIVLDPSQTPVAQFPGNVSLNGNSLLNVGNIDCNMIAGQDCSNLGSGGSVSGDYWVNESGDTMAGDLFMSGSHIRDVDDINFNGGGNAFSAMALPQESGASLSVARNLWGRNSIMRWNRNNITEVFGPMNMKGNDIRNVGSSNVDMQYDSTDGRMEITSNGNVDICIGNC